MLFVEVVREVEAVPVVVIARVEDPLVESAQVKARSFEAAQADAF